MNNDLKNLKPYPMAILQERKAALRAEGQTLFDFGTGDPVEPTPEHIRQALINAVPEVSQYPSVQGTPLLKQAVVDYVARRFAVELDVQQHVLPSAGSKEAVFHLPLAFIDPATEQDGIIYGTPAYPVYRHGGLFAHGTLHEISLSAEQGYLLNPDALSSDILATSKIMWLNYPHNPSGAGASLTYLQEMSDLCREHDIILINDECYADTYFNGHQPPPSLLQCGLTNNLVIHSCSKRSGMTGYRSGFIAGDRELIAEYRRWRVAMGVASPVFVEAAGAAAWSDDSHAAERRAIFDRKRQVLATGLAERGIEVFDSAGGLYLWCRVPQGFDDQSYAERCLEAGIIISPGGFFAEHCRDWFRLAVVPSIDDCHAALTRWP